MFKIVICTIIPFLGTALGAAMVFFMKDKINELNRIQKISDIANGKFNSKITFEQYILSIYFEDVIEEANIICDDLVKKITNSNGRSIDLPVSIDSIIDYGISTYVNPKDIDKLLYYITIKLSVIYNFYKD